MELFFLNINFVHIKVTQCNVDYEFLVSKETVVLRRWERSKQKFGFIPSSERIEELWVVVVYIRV